MDGNRFDNWARARAQKLSRRKAVGVAGATGLAVAVSRVLPASAQGSGPTCQMTIQALTSAGPSIDTAYSGVLEITLGTDGAIDTGSLAFDGGPTVPVVGESEGRALSLRAMFPNGNALVLTGTGEFDIDTCSGALSGVFGGPELGDTGSWLIDPDLSVLLDPGSGIVTVTPPPINSPTPTPTPACPGVECEATFVVDPATCDCVCPDPTEACGPICCPSGAECIDEAAGECNCPYGTELCGDSCVESCEMGYHLDSDTCECVEGCGEPTPCPEGEIYSEVTCDCESYCNTNSEAPYYCGGDCYEEPYSECNGQCYPTASLNSNSDMCGVSCQVCPDGVPCIGGSCECPAGYSYCDGDGCKDLSEDSDHCGDCGHVCAVGTSCQGGTCQL